MSVNYYYDLQIRKSLKGSQKTNNKNILLIQHVRRWKNDQLKSNSGNKNNDFQSSGERPTLYAVMVKIYHNMNMFIKQCPTFNQELKPANFVRALKTIIPLEYFGTRQNRKTFFKLVEKILTQNRGEYVHTCMLYEGYNIDGFPWFDENNMDHIRIMQANYLLLETVVKPFISKYCFFLNSYKNREYQVVSPGKAHSFIDQSLRNNIKRGFMEKVLPSSTSQNWIIGTLVFVPKKSIHENVHRPILRFRSNALQKRLDDSMKIALKKLSQEFGLGINFNLFKKWETFLKSLEDQSIPLYALKIDLLDAFGMVDVEVLITIIVSDKKYLSAYQKDVLIDTLSKSCFYVRGKKILYRWNHGLLQGTRLSPVLCNLYLSYITYNTLKPFIGPGMFLHRCVDDMFFVSTTEDKLNEFDISTFSMSILNEGKTHKFTSPELDDPRIVYCGKIFNMMTKETSAAFDFQEGKELRGRFKIWNVNRQFSKTRANEFICNAMQFSYVNFFFSPFELNTTGNSAQSVLRNIFHGMCFVAFKFYYVISSIDYLFKTSEERTTVATECVEVIAVTYPPFIHRLIKMYRGSNYKPIFTYDLIGFLCYKAFSLVLIRAPPRYRSVVNNLKAKTKKTQVIVCGTKLDLAFVSKLPHPFEKISFKRK